MYKEFLNKAILFIQLLIFSAGSFSQSKTSVQANIDKRRIVIGEHIQLTLQAAIPENEPIRFFEIDSIPHFEFLEKRKIDTLNTATGTVLKQIFRITSFDSGSFVIPSFVLPGNKQILTDSIPVEVGFAPFDPNKDYNDIKDIIEVKVEEEKKDWYWKIVVGAAILLLVVVLVIYFLKRRKKPDRVIKASINAYEVAMKQLEQLKKENPPAKIFYTRLVQILREYVFHKKGIQSLQRTTEELVLQFQSFHMPAEDYNALSQALRLSDFVKFARFQPDEKDTKIAFETIKNTIDKLEKLQTHSPSASGRPRLAEGG